MPHAMCCGPNDLALTIRQPLLRGVLRLSPDLKSESPVLVLLCGDSELPCIPAKLREDPLFYRSGVAIRAQLDLV